MSVSIYLLLSPKTPEEPIIFKIPDTSEIKFLQKSSPDLELLSPEEVSHLDLEKGVCFVQSNDDCSDTLLRRPQKVAVRPRTSLHGGETLRSIDN